MLLYYLRHAIRRLRRDVAFTASAGLTLALGIGANLAVFAVVEAVLLRPLPYADAGDIVVLDNRDLRTGITKQYIGIGDYIDIASRQHSFAAIAAYNTNPNAMLFGAGDPLPVVALQVQPSFFNVLRTPAPALGRLLQSEDGRVGGPNVVVLGQALWQSRFGGDSGIVGRSIRIGPVDRTVVGVASPGFAFPPGATADVIMPMQLPASAPAQRKYDWTFAVARLAPGRDVAAASADLDAISKQLAAEYPDQNAGSTHYAQSLRDAVVGNTKQALLLLFGTVTVVLLIACGNVANLLLARSFGRRREMALRLALGASRARLAALFMTESLVLAVAASGLGLVLAVWGSRALVRLVPASMAVPGLADTRVDSRVLAACVGLCVVSALIFGAVAALTVRRDRVADVLVTGTRASMSALARRATAGLVVAEIALAVVLLSGAGLIVRSVATLVRVDPGFDYEHVLTATVSIPATYTDSLARATFHQRALEAARAIPGVEDAGEGAVVPLTGNNWTTSFVRADRPLPAGERAPEVGWQIASAGFFSTMQIPLESGRLFDPTDRPGTRRVVIVSQSLERRFFPGESAVGKRMGTGPASSEIVGVVGDIRRATLRGAPREDVYFPAEEQPATQTTMFLRTAGDPMLALVPLRAALKAIEPNVVLRDERSMQDIAARSLGPTYLTLWLLGLFATVALLLAAVGIYGVMSYAVRQRTREIGTRMALGATRGDVLAMILRQGALVAGLGAAIGLAGGIVATRALRAMLFGVTTYDPVTLILTTLVLGATLLLACYLPARRAAATDPSRTLADFG